jgi:hypothetical protein
MALRKVKLGMKTSPLRREAVTKGGGTIQRGGFTLTRPESCVGDTTGFSRGESANILTSEIRLKLKLHVAKAGGVLQTSCRLRLG